MQSVVAQRVGALINEVSRIERESESSYLALGNLFPALAAEMEKSAKNARASLDGFSSVTGGESNANLRSMAAFAEESSRYFASVHERDSEFLSHINESIERLTSLEDVIGRVRADSEEMEIISLNAMTVALKSGNAGKAFSVITEELKRLSSRTIAVTESITARGRDLMECFGGLRDSLRSLDEFQEEFFRGLDTTLSQGYKGLERDIRQSIELFGRLTQEAMAVREPVQSIMQGIQFQDIIRQSLQHVTISFNEAKQAAVDAEASELSSDSIGTDRNEDLAFVAAIAELSGSLISDIVKQIDAGASAFGNDISKISSIVEGAEAKRRGYVDSVKERTFDADKAAKSFSAGSLRYLELKKKVIQTSRRLSEQVQSLDESFRGLAGLLSRFQNIVVASRIEVAKNRALSGVANTVQGMIQLTDRIGIDVGEAMGTTKDFIKVSYTAIAEYAGTSAEDLGGLGSGGGLGRGLNSFEAGHSESDKMQATLVHVEKDIRGLDAARARVSGALGGFYLYTPEFIVLISKAREQLATIEDFGKRLRVMEAEVAELRGSIFADKSFDASKASIKNERLKAMIEQFTIFAHKKTASTIGRFDVEDGVEAGDVTLF